MPSSQHQKHHNKHNTTTTTTTTNKMHSSDREKSKKHTHAHKTTNTNTNTTTITTTTTTITPPSPPTTLAIATTTTTNTSTTTATTTTTHVTTPTGTKPFAIRVSSAGGTILPLQEALCNIKSLAAGTINLSPGYESYTRRLLLPLPTEYDNALHDDLSADEAFELPTPRNAKPSNWRKVRNIVQWTPFIQTYKKHKYPWVQLAGHQGNFRAGHKQGTILKKLCPAEEKALEAIMKDILRPYVPRYSGVVEGADGEKYLQLEDLLSNYTLPCVMDIKMGVRTYLEDELAKAREKPKLRKDMYEKMIQIDPKAPTEAEHRAKAVTKPRYMVWRETISSTATQGFRLEGVRRGDGTSSKDFKTTRTREQVLTCLASFLQGYSHASSHYVQQLKSIKMTLEASPFFKTHELIGSSLLFVHNESSALVRMIDFAKTVPLPLDVNITHRSPWSEGTHEDGYLLGLDNLIDLFSALDKSPNSPQKSNTNAYTSVTPSNTSVTPSNTSVTPSNTSVTPTSLPLTTPNGTLASGSSNYISPTACSPTSITPVTPPNPHTTASIPTTNTNTTSASSTSSSTSSPSPVSSVASSSFSSSSSFFSSSSSSSSPTSTSPGPPPPSSSTSSTSPSLSLSSAPPSSTSQPPQYSGSGEGGGELGQSVSHSTTTTTTITAKTAPSTSSSSSSPPTASSTLSSPT